MRAENRSATRNLAHLAMVLLIFGSVWGMSEVLLGGALRATHFRYTSALLTGVGMAITTMALVWSKNIIVPIGAGLVAALVTLLVVPILHVSVMCRANSCIALVIESTSLGLLATLFMTKMRSSALARIAVGGLAAVVASIGFYTIGIHAAPCAYLYSFGSTSSFVLREGLFWAAFSAVLLPLGYAAGVRMSLGTMPLPKQGSPAFYSAATAVAALCWGASAVAISSGL